MMIGTAAPTTSETTRNPQPTAVRREAFPFVHDNIEDIETAVVNNDQERFSPPQQQLLLELVTSIKVLEDQIKAAKELPGFDPSKFNKEIDTLRKKLTEIETLPKEETDPDSFLKTKESELAKESNTFKKLKDIKDKAREYESFTDMDVPFKETSLVEIKKELADQLKAMIEDTALKSEEKELLKTSVPEAVEDITKKHKKGTGLNLFQKVMVWFNIKAMKKDYSWLKEYVEKNVFNKVSSDKERSKAAEEYIAKNYEEVAKQEEKKREAELEKSRPLAPVKEEEKPAPEPIQEPLAKVTVEPEITAGERAKQKQSEYYRQLHEKQENGSVTVESVLKSVEKAKSGTLAEAQEKINTFLDEIAAEEISGPPKKQIDYITRSLLYRIQTRNEIIAVEDLDKFYERVITATDSNETFTDNFRKEVKDEIRVKKGAVETLIKQRQNQYETINNLLLKAKSAAKLSLGLDRLTESELLEHPEFQKETEKLFSKAFTAKLADQVVRWGLVEGDPQSFKNKVQEYVEAGAITLELAVDEHNYGVPAIITRDLITKDDKGNTITISGSAILNEITGGRPKHEENTPNVVAYQLSIGSEEEGGSPLQVVSMSLPNESEIDYDVRSAIKHELVHATMAAKKEAYLNSLQTRLNDLSFREAPKDDPKRKPTAYQRFKTLMQEQHGLPEEAVEGALKEYLFGKEKDPLQNVKDETIRNVFEAEITASPDPERKPLVDSKGYLRTLSLRHEKYIQSVEEGWGNPLEELAAKAADATDTLTLDQIDIYKFNINNKMHRTALGVMRLVNDYTKIAGAVDPSKRNERDALFKRQGFLGNYLGVSLGTDLEEVDATKVIAKLIEAADAEDTPDKKVPKDLELLRTCIVDDLQLITTEPIGEEEFKLRVPALSMDYAAFVIKASEDNPYGVKAVSPEQMNRLREGIAILLDAKKTEAERLAVIGSLKNMFPDIELPYLEHLNSRTARLISYFLAPAEDYEYLGEATASDDPADKFRRSLHPQAPLRHSAREGANAYLYYGRNKRDIMGAKGMGDKVDVNYRYKHPKDVGPSLLQFGGLNQKVLMDSFGVGLNDFRTDSNDGFEGMYFLTGISWHKMPWLQNLPKVWEKTFSFLPEQFRVLDKKAWSPDAILAPSIDAYTYGVVKDIFGRVSMEKVYDGQSLVRIVTELGGYEYDAQGQPHAEMSTYSHKDDNYRLNSDFAEFIETKLMTGPNAGRSDLQEIVNRMRKDKMYHNGNLVDVEERNGNIYVAGTEEIVQEGRLKIGQITKNVIDEMKEIMVYYENTNVKPPVWKLGVEMAGFLDYYEKPEKAYKAMKKIVSVAEAMMKEDDKRRQNKQGSYTIMDLLIELERVQNLPTEPLLDKSGHGSSNPKVSTVAERYKDPKIIIGGEGFSSAAAKEMLEHFSLSRSEKVLTVGVWERGPVFKHKNKSDEPIPLRPDEAEHVLYDVKMDPTTGNIDKNLKTNVVRHEIPDKVDAVIFEVKDPADPTDPNKSKFYYQEINQRGIPVTYEVESADWKYSKDAKLSFLFKQTGYLFTLDPIKGLPPEILLRYYGRKEPYNILVDGKSVPVRGRKDYSTEEGQMFDDVYDTLTKIRMGKSLSYRFSVKLYQIDKYRDYSKMRKEYYEGLLLLEGLFRKGVLGLTVLGLIVPSLAFLSPPGLILGTLAWALAGQPFLVRAAKGWAARLNASLEAQGSVIGDSGMFFKLADESSPPSFGELDIATSAFESVKFKYRSVLKNFNDGAKWNTNAVTNLFSTAWDKVANKPPFPI